LFVHLVGLTCRHVCCDSGAAKSRSGKCLKNMRVPRFQFYFTICCSTNVLLPNIRRDLCCLHGKPLRSGMPSRSPDMHGSMSHAHGLQFASLASLSHFEEIMGSVVICIFIGAFEVNPFFWRLPWWPHPAVDIIVYYMVWLRCLWCTYAGCEPPGICYEKGLPSFNLRMTRFAAIP